MGGSLDDPQARANLRITDAIIYGEKIDGVAIDLSLQGSVARIDSGRIHNERGEIALAGQYDLKEENFTASLHTEGLVFSAPETFGRATLPLGGLLSLNLAAEGYVHAPKVEGKILVREFEYDTLYFGNYDLDCQLDDDTLRFSLMSENEDLILRARMILGGIFESTADLRLRHYVLDQYIAPAAGYVTAHVAAEGALARIKDVAGKVQIDTMRLLVEQRPLENTGSIIAELRDRMIYLRSCEFVIAGQNLNANGIIPLEFDAGDMDIAASSGEIQLSDIAYLLPGDPAISGRLRFDLRVQGKPRTLDLDGILSLTDAGFKAEYLIVDSVNSLIRFKNGLITTNHFHGKLNRGRFDIVGFADVSRGLLDTMLFQVKVDRVDYANKNFGHVLCSADLKVGARKDSLRINGELTINEAAYTAPMKLETYVRLLTNVNRPVPQQPEIFRRIYCDVGIGVPDSILIANNIANLAVRADLQLKGYLARLNAYGTIAAINEGTIQYLGKKFRIVNAVIQFDDPYKIDPVIDLMATSTVVASDGEYEIYLRLEGTTTTWQLVLNSNPPVPEQDIVSLLLIGQRRPGAVSGMAKETDLKGKVRDYALDMVRHNIEKKTQEILDLDEFTHTGDLSDPTQMRIGIAKSLTRGFKLHYSTGLESWELYQIGASYDLNDKISIFTLYDQENRNSSVDLEYHLKIK
jgi:translocation and assembly module TamB